MHALHSPTARCSYIKLIKDDQIEIEVDGPFFFFSGLCWHLLPDSVMEHLEEISMQLIVKWSAETETPTTYDLSSLLTCRVECGNGVRCSNAVRLLGAICFYSSKWGEED